MWILSQCKSCPLCQHVSWLTDTGLDPFHKHTAACQVVGGRQTHCRCVRDFLFFPSLNKQKKHFNSIWLLICETKLKKNPATSIREIAFAIKKESIEMPMRSIVYMPKLWFQSFGFDSKSSKVMWIKAIFSSTFCSYTFLSNFEKCGEQTTKSRLLTV